MRSKRESTIFEEKNFISEDETVQTQAACLNRIFRKVNSTGLSADTIQELRDDIYYVAERYHIDNQEAVLLAAILEKSATNNLMDDEDLAMYLGCTNIEFIRYHKKLRDMEDNIQYVISGKAKCFYIVTNNKKDYDKLTNINVVVPSKIRRINQ